MSGGKETDECSGKLPAGGEYALLGARVNCSKTYEDQTKNGNIVEDVGGPLELWLTNNDKSDAKRIVEAYCHANTQTRAVLTNYYDLCHFFYYWLGDLIKGKLPERRELHQVMEVVYAKLGGFKFRGGFSHKCENLYPGISKSVFVLYKKIFDYAYNYKSLESKSEVKNKFLCSSECATYVKEVEQAYSSAIGACGSATSDRFCRELTSEYNKYFDNNKPKWTCTTTTSEVDEDPDDDDDDDFDDELFPKEFQDLDQVDGPLSTLPSRKDYYKFFDEGMSKCDREDWSWPNQIKAALEGDENIGEHAEEIAKALCHAYEKKGKDTPSNKLPEEYCDFYYFWVGDIFWNNSRKRTFKGIMDQIKDAVGNSTSDHGCSFRFKTKGLNSFLSSKLLFDYYKDKDDMKSHLNFDSEEEIGCNDAYYEYFVAARKAYEIMHKKCPKEDTKGTNEWCKKFHEMYKDCSNGGGVDGKSQCWVARESTKSCTEDSKPDTLDTTSSSTANDTNSVTPGAVAGGTIATIGIPTIGFFLYKYTDVFDGIKKSLFGELNNRSSNRNRGRRSTIGRQHFEDTFTGNDSSTLGGDGSTTLGGESSTLGGSSTDISTIYDDGRRRPTGRTRTGINNRRPGNIRYYAT
ncbi:KIR protein [Plasmodium knowlesi strain H]|uniref:KIR protein n=3 Tax=Plasmodium knowlesi TaxID=5850 RepID=B3LCC8_PLAKH|nr:KIR protein [Plasmodium knowlesi strain H]OTN63877.1 KIR protein [Plasmodium knowlesi]CAA9990924.1 KIR protein [Plasmodium knowlesi strain H]SBO20854.1 KIR protein [Plasmodium knowlesi strain H]VVS80398.1 KIR protein [Plasmodium knowlesi strain H]|eukprot:XP_002262209.1 KIR protein [Plasmodium knowlesi strain H]